MKGPESAFTGNLRTSWDLNNKINFLNNEEILILDINYIKNLNS